MGNQLLKGTIPPAQVVVIVSGPVSLPLLLLLCWVYSPLLHKILWLGHKAFIPHLSGQHKHQVWACSLILPASDPCIYPCLPYLQSLEPRAAPSVGHLASTLAMPAPPPQRRAKRKNKKGATIQGWLHISLFWPHRVILASTVCFADRGWE